MRRAAVLLAGVTLLLTIAFFVFRTPDSDPAEMLAKYGGGVSKFATAPSGLSVHYRDQGCRNCPAILLAHGSNASLHTFEPLIRILEDRYRLISFDLQGHGLTGPHPRDDYSAQSMIETIETVAAAAEVERFAIAGNSMGGWIAWRFALANPEKLSALVLISAAGAPPLPDAGQPRLYLGARIMRNPAGRFLAKHITPRFVVRQSLLDSIANDADVTERMVDRYWDLLHFPGNRRATGIRAKIDREPHYGLRLSELTVPTLIVWGEEDHVIPPYNAHTFDDMIPNSDLQIFDGVGHLAMEEAPQRTAAAISTFLEKVSPAADQVR
jgi:pimeloyl-ACP methyl ester carboxylesterase